MDQQDSPDFQVPVVAASQALPGTPETRARRERTRGLCPEAQEGTAPQGSRESPELPGPQGSPAAEGTVSPESPVALDCREIEDTRERTASRVRREKPV